MFSKYYGFEYGVLLNKEDEEFKHYSCNNPLLPYGFYDEGQGYCEANKLTQMQTDMRNYVENGVDLTYAIISHQGACKTSVLLDLIKECSVEGMDYSFFRNTSMVFYSVCKKEGKIVEGFLEDLIEATKDQKRGSLDNQIQSASTRAAESQATSPVKAKEPEHEI